MEFLVKAQPIVLVVFVYATMIYLGLSMTLPEIWQQVKRPRPVLVTLVLNLLVSPLLAVVLGWLFALPAPAYTAIVLISLFGGAPAGPKNVEIAGGDRPLSVSLVIVVSLAVLFVVPFSARLFLPDIQGSAWLILRNLLNLILLPLAIGLLVRAFLPRVAKPLLRIEGLVSNLFMGLVILCFVLPELSALVLVGGRVLLVFLGIIVGGFLLAFFLPTGTMAVRKAVSLITITKNFGVAMAIAPVTFAQLNLTPYLMCYIVLLLVLSLPGSFVLRRATGKRMQSLGDTQVFTHMPKV